MLSEKQRIANRNNSLRSTGPRTFEGKRAASRNAVRHGLLSSADLTVIRGEDRTEFKEFFDNLRGDLKPVGQLESLLAERITSFFWRLKRTSRMEQGLLDILSSAPQEADGPVSKKDIPIAVIIHKTYAEPEKDFEYQEYLKSKGRLDANGVALPAPVDPAVQNNPPSAVSESAPAASEEVVLSEEQFSENLGRMVQQDFKGSKLLEKLLRYEGQIERSLYRAMLELQKLQSNRTRSEALDAEDVSPDEIVVEDLPAVGWALAHAEAEKPNKPISEEISPPQAFPPIENGNLKMENPSDSSPHFQGSVPQSREGVLPLAESWPLEAGSCNPEKPNKPISEIENGNLKMENPSESSQGGLPQSGEGVLPLAGWPLEAGSCSPEKPNKPILEQLNFSILNSEFSIPAKPPVVPNECEKSDQHPTPQAVLPIENGNLKMENPSLSSPHFQGGLPRSGEGVLKEENATFDICNPEIPNKPISEEISPPQALPPIENSKWKIENAANPQSPIISNECEESMNSEKIPLAESCQLSAASSQSTPHFQGGLPRSGEGVLKEENATFDICNPEIPNKPISEEISPPQALPPIENSKWKIENAANPQSPTPQRCKSRFDLSAGRTVRPSMDSSWSSSRHRPSNSGTAYSHLSDEELARLAVEMEYQSNPVPPKPAIVNDLSHLTDEELDRMAKELG